MSSGGASGRVGGGYPLLLWKVLTVIFSELGRIYVKVSSKSKEFNCSFLKIRQNLNVVFFKSRVFNCNFLENRENLIVRFSEF